MDVRGASAEIQAEAIGTGGNDAPGQTTEASPAGERQSNGPAWPPELVLLA